MNKRGNPKSLVAAHPGNLNTVKQGIHSPRLIQARAAEIATELTQSFEFSPAEQLAAHEAARCIAILEAIDRDLDQRGLVDREGQPRYLLNHRSRTSRQLEHWLEKVSAAEQVRMAEIDLDSPNPAVLYYTSFGTGESKTLSLNVTRVDAEQIELLARTRHSMIDLEVEVFYSARDGNGSVVVHDSGKPFRVTAETASKAYGVGSDGEAFRVPESDGTQLESVC